MLLKLQSRLEALIQIQEMLVVDQEKSSSLPTVDAGSSNRTGFSSSLLNAVSQQFVIGCFDLGVLNNEAVNAGEIHHYQVP